MALSSFDDRTRPPTQDQLRSVLGRAYAPWVKLLTLVADRIHPITPVWKFSTGWSLRVLHKERVILYLTPQKGQFLVSMALGERAVAAAHAAKLAASVLKVIDNASRYAEGRGVRLPVRGGRQLTALARLAQIKREN
jgi:Protein of unknown function (DUF3788)